MRPEAAASDQREAAHARRLIAANETPTAERICISVLDRDPGQPDALRLLFEIRKAGGELRAAEALIRRLVARDPNDAAAAIELAVLLMENGTLDEAERHARNAVRIAPVSPFSHNALAMVLTEAQKLHAGEFHYRRVLMLSPAQDPILLANLAWNLKQQGRMEEARELYRASTARAPGVRQTLLGWARMEEADRQFDRANEILDDAERRFPGDPEFLKSRAILLGRAGRPDAALAMLERLERAAPDAMGPDGLAEKAALLDRLGRFDEAFAAAVESKRTLRRLTGERYHGEQAAEMVGRLTRFFTARRVGILPRAGFLDTAPQPIFILGFPRSGTTLVEQMLSAHADISAGDELPIITDITALIPSLFASPLAYPEALAEFWMAEHHDGPDVLRDLYLRRADQMGALRADTRWFTDKMPLNETNLGLISLIFPRSPLIHVLRHPLDVVLSVFFNHMTHGYFCAYDLESAARHYALVMDLVEHYRRELELNYLPIRYESVVGDQQASVRAMLDFVGASFDPACLRPHENRRYARTASYAQVTEKIHSRSCNRYRHYRKHLDPILPLLRPAIERLGYDVE